MNLQRSFAKLLPHWAILLATDFRCLLRCALVLRKIPQRNITSAAALIVAPHPDDETFGCGGLIRTKVLQGIPLRVVLLTDGEAVGSGFCESPETVIAARKREALEACLRLGVAADSVCWLHL